MRRSLPCLIVMLFCQLISTLAQSQLQKIYVHPKTPGNEKQSKFVDSIRFIPLEIKEGIELTTHANVEVTANYIMIRNYANKEALLYTKNGRFVKKISYKKLGDYFYPVYDEHKDQLVFWGSNRNYQLTSRDRIKVKMDWSNPRNKKYFKKYKIDLKDTTFTIKKDIPQQNDILNSYHYYDDVYGMGSITTSELYKDSLDHELKLYKGNQLIKSYFPYNHINEAKYLYAEESITRNQTDDPYVQIISRPYCDTIYKLVKDSLWPAYQVVLPLENSLPASFFNKPFKNKADRENFRRNNGWMFHQVYMFFETPRFIYFLMAYQSNYETYLYQKKTNTICQVKNIKPDSSQYNLQLFEQYGNSRKQDKFYKTLKAGDILPFFEKNKNVPVPKELESFIKSNPPETSPVIIEFKLKN